MNKISKSIKNLPPLKKGYMRLVHRTFDPELEKKIMENGFKYKGDISTNTHAFSDEKSAEHYAVTGKMKGTPFEYPGCYAFIFDVPWHVHKKHYKPTTWPHILPKKYFKGSIRIHGKKPGLEKTLGCIAIVSFIISLVFFTGITGNIIGGSYNLSTGILFILIGIISMGMFYFNRRKNE